MPFLQIACLVSWLLVARPRRSLSQPNTWHTRLDRRTDNCYPGYSNDSVFVYSYMAGLRPFRRKPHHVEAPHVLQRSILRRSYYIGHGLDEDASFLCLEGERMNLIRLSKIVAQEVTGTDRRNNWNKPVRHLWRRAIDTFSYIIVGSGH